MKRLLAVLMALALSVSASACGGGGGGKTQAPGPSGSSGPSGATQVSIGLWGLQEVKAGTPSEKMRDYFAGVYGIEFVPWIVSEQDSREKLASAAAAGNLPDMFAMDVLGDTAFFRQLIAEKKIREIPEEIFRNYHWLGTTMYRYRNTESVDGKMWFVPRADMAGRYDNGSSVAIWYRLDKALESGLMTAGQAPTWKEFIDLMGYYARLDLNGNGIDDTWALTASGAGLGGLWTVFFMPFGVRDWVLEGGKWVPGVLSSRAKEAVKWANVEFRSGHIDPAFSTQSADEALDAFCSGKAAMLVADCSPEGADRMNAALKAKSPGLDVAKAVSVLPQPVNPWGVAYNDETSWHTGVLFNASVRDAKLNKILKLMDWLMSADGLTYASWGQKGVDYNVTGDGLQTLHRDDRGLPVLFNQLNAEWGAMATMATWANDFMPAASKDDYRWKYIDILQSSWWANVWRAPMFTRNIDDPAVRGFDADHRAEAALADIVRKSIDVDKDWDAYVARMNQELNVDAVSQIVNDYAQKNNITKEE